MYRDTTKSYSGRQFDLELLKHVEEMLPTQPVEPDIQPVPRIVSGIEKAVQRYAKLFLTDSGSVKLAEGVGNNLLSSIGRGQVSSLSHLKHLYALANAEVLSELKTEDANTVFGDIPDDERIVSTKLIDLNMDYASRTIKVHISLTTAAGESFLFIIPVGSGLR